MSNKSHYTVLGWVVWQLGSRLAKTKAGQNKGKLGAGAAVALIVIGGILVAAGDSDDVVQAARRRAAQALPSSCAAWCVSVMI